MDWNGLKTFLTIAEAGSLAGAAKRLGVNHSTVYRRLLAFETEIGSKLFNQDGNRYVLTEMGEALASQGQRIQSDFDSLERTLVGKEQLPKGTVKITAPFNLANRVLPHALLSLRVRYPDIQVDILSSNQALNMNSRIADIAVRATPAPPEHLVGKKVCELAWGVFAAKSYLKTAPPLQTQQDLALHRLVGGTGAMLDLPAFAWLEKQFSHRIHTRCDELTAMSYFAEQGHGVAVLPMDQCRVDLQLVFILSEISASQIWLLTHPDLRKVARIRIVMDELAHFFATWQPAN